MSQSLARPAPSRRSRRIAWPRRAAKGGGALTAAVAAIAFVIGACAPEAEPYGSARAVLAAMRDGGVSCSYVDAAINRRLVESNLTCLIHDQEVGIFTFETTADRNKWLRLGRLYGPVVEGPNWVVLTRSAKIAERISGVLGGTVETPAG